MGYGKGPGAVGGSEKWECPCRGKNTGPKGEEEWPSRKVGELFHLGINQNQSEPNQSNFRDERNHLCTWEISHNSHVFIIIIYNYVNDSLSLCKYFLSQEPY